ncbi:MAG: UDP-N-acetylmuramate--L-alanine ligase [Solirubrobacterales bacterium]|nr:UDP-N-acetylmuramate--L-alanine ligase [Solirubrobacterales bacterium]
MRSTRPRPNAKFRWSCSAGSDALTSAKKPWAGRQLHFVAIGGAGMSGLALIAASLGASVTGSDRAETAYLGPVRAAGVQPVVGEHAADNVPAGGEVVYSTAIPFENPERAVARAAGGGGERHRAELLAEIARLKRLIAITGTHGKTTTTAMLAHVLAGAGLDPAYYVGGELRSTGLNAAWGDGDWIVVEADESDRSLLNFSPEIAVLTNAELDHHSTYASRLDLDNTFREFTGRADSAVVWDRPELLALAEGAGRLIPYDARSVEAGPAGTSFSWRGLEVKLGVPGLHNAVNAAGALSAAAAAGAEPAAAVAAIASFRGARRRLELLGTTPSGAAVYDDYAHHPTELAAAIAAARTLAPRRLVAVFQPHLFSRTAALARGFGQALAGADVAVVLDVYPARERAADFPAVDGRLVAAAAADYGAGKQVAWLPRMDDAHAWLGEILHRDDLVLCMGAGNVDSLGRRLVGGGDA